MSEAPDDLYGSRRPAAAIVPAALLFLTATALMSGASFVLVYLFVM